VTPNETQSSTAIGPALSQKDIDELKVIYHRKYGEDLADDDAWEMGNRLIRVFAVLTRRSAESESSPQGSNRVRVD